MTRVYSVSFTYLYSSPSLLDSSTAWRDKTFLFYLQIISSTFCHNKPETLAKFSAAHTVRRDNDLGCFLSLPSYPTSVTTRLRRTVPLPFQDPFYAPKILFIYKCWPTSLPMNKVTLSYSTLHIPLTARVHMHIVCFSFIYSFISFFIYLFIYCLFVCLFVCLLLLFIAFTSTAVFTCYPPRPRLQGC